MKPLPTPARQALALALASAVSLGLARFSYALLLPPMREDLGWSYLTGGAMNTANALGYLLGALTVPWLMARRDLRALMLAGGFGSAALLVLHGTVRADTLLYALRFAAGLASAASFIGGGVLAMRLAEQPGVRPGLVLGVYYGGTGLGIVGSALTVPAVTAAAGWPWAWAALGALALASTLFTQRGSAGLDGTPTGAAARGRTPLARLAFGLAAYTMFGLGAIGYMTFAVTLLREQGLGAGTVTAFYVLLGAGVVASSWLWAGLLQRHRGGVPLALLNGLLAVAAVLPVLGAHPVLVFASGALFGSVFQSVVAATSALVRHQLPPHAWPGGIAAFTICFASGQIVGPSLVGAVADRAGGLALGLAICAGLLALGSVLALGQRVPANT